MAQSILGWWGLKFVKMEGAPFFKKGGGVIKYSENKFDEIEKSSSPESMGQLQPHLAQCICECRGFNFI